MCVRACVRVRVRVCVCVCVCVSRALTLTTTPRGNESSLASLALCAGFDFVEYSSDGYVRVYVKTQDGYRAHSVEFLEGIFFFFVRFLSSNKYKVDFDDDDGDLFDNDDDYVGLIVLGRRADLLGAK